MQYLIPLTLVLPMAISFPGCPFVTRTTTVRLENNANFPVEVRLYYDNDQNAPEDLIKIDGSERNLVIPAGEVQAFSVDCDDLQAIFIDNAKLNVIGGIGPEASTGVYRDGDDFSCGDRLCFTFTQGLLPTDLDIDFAQNCP